ncbi:MAG TPA: amidase domain-containing protein [Symbiobacteriaceae bacterium]
MSTATVQSSLNAYLEARCSVIQGGNPSKLATFYDLAVADARNRVKYDQEYLVRYYQEPYKANGYTITDCHFDLKDLHIDIDRRSAQVTVAPVVRYDYRRPGWTTGQTVEEGEGVHTLVLRLTDPGTLKITQHNYDDFFHGNLPDGPFQRGQVVIEPNQKVTNQAFLPPADHKLSLSEKMQVEEAKTIAGAGTTANTVNVALTSMRYDFVSAASYAWAWACEGCRNDSYPGYPSDCTNFASQAVHDSQGGKAPNYYVRWGDAWYINGRKPSYYTSDAWRLVINFRRLLLFGGGGPHGTAVGNPDNLVRGDIIIFQLEGASAPWNHTTLVCSYSQDGTPQLCYHSRDVRDRPWNTMPYKGVTAISMDSAFIYP